MLSLTTTHTVEIDAVSSSRHFQIMSFIRIGVEKKIMPKAYTAVSCDSGIDKASHATEHWLGHFSIFLAPALRLLSSGPPGCRYGPAEMVTSGSSAAPMRPAPASGACALASEGFIQLWGFYSVLCFQHQAVLLLCSEQRNWRVVPNKLLVPHCYF